MLITLMLEGAEQLCEMLRWLAYLEQVLRGPPCQRADSGEDQMRPGYVCEQQSPRRPSDV